MGIPEVTYAVTRARLEAEAPAYLRFVVDGGLKEARANVTFRERLRERCRVDVGFRGVVLELCRRDVLFFANLFCCLEEPRGKDGSLTLPFITYPYQDRFLLDVYPCQGVRSTHTLKSRATGWTWMMYGIVRVHRFVFTNAKMLVASREKDLVDSTENPDTLMAKFDFVMARLPWWFAPKYAPEVPRCKQLMHRFNPGTRAVMTGAATAEDIGRGGRRTEADLDEHASWELLKGAAAQSSLQFVTECINAGSTPKGDVGAFRDGWFNEESQALKIELKWEDHPVYRRGLYTTKNEKVVFLDDDFWGRDGILWSRWVGNKLIEYTRETYPFVLDGELRSPWFDDQCRKLSSPRMIAQELQRSFLGSDDVFFDHGLLRKLETTHAEEPIFKCGISLDEDTFRVESFDGEVNGLWWFWIDPRKIPADERYAIGVDVGYGQKTSMSSNSVITAFNARTGRQVLEMASNAIRPRRLAEYANGIGHWLNRAMIGWEMGSPGQVFLDRIVTELAYPNLFHMRKNEKEGGFKLARSPGWWPRPQTKLAAFQKFAQDQASEKIVVLSKSCYAEQRQFVWVSPDEVAHRKSLAVDVSFVERKKNHGDRMSAALIAHKCMTESVTAKKAPKIETVKPWSMKWLLDRQNKEVKAMTPSGRPYGEPYHATT